MHDYTSKVSRSACLLLLGSAGIVLFALREPVAYDFQAYAAVSGFEASRWTWLLVACGSVFAAIGLFSRHVRAKAALANAIAAAIVAFTIAATARAMPDRVEPTRSEIDCTNHNIGIGCRAHQVVDALRPAPPDAAPSRVLLVGALGAYAVLAVVLSIHTRVRARVAQREVS